LSLDNSNRFTAMSQYQKQSNILTHTISTVLCAGHPGWAGTSKHWHLWHHSLMKEL